MNKGELIAGMAEESGVSKADTEKVLNAFLSQVEKALCAGDKAVSYTHLDVYKRQVHAGVPHGAGEHGVPAGVPLCRHGGEQHQVRLPGRYP